MDLKQKLDNLKPILALSRERPENVIPGDTARQDSLLGGEMVETPHGPCYRVRSSYHPSYRHGSACLAGVTGRESIDLSLPGRDPDFSNMDPARTVFLDTETTGLAGGTGTYAFLVGLGRFDGARFVIDQYFMRDFSREPALLWALERDWSDAGWLVSYNGRAYDVPLLASRFIMQRCRTGLQELPHLDLLHVVRRLFRRRIGNCNLTRVEREVLGHFRDGDVPGSLIPNLYFNFLRSGDPAPLVPVFEHNAQDILALAALLARVRELFDGDARPGHGLDLLSLGALYQNLGRDDRAAGALARARDAQVSGPARMELMERLGLSLKRLGRLEEAEEVWRSMVQAMIEPRILPYEELAKLCEHRRRDYAAARGWVLKGLRRIEMTAALYGERDAGGDFAALRYRLARLERKIGRESGSGASD